MNTGRRSWHQRYFWLSHTSAKAFICLFIYWIICLSYFFILFFADDSVSWVSAENLWILGRYMVHLSFEEITKISPVEVSWKSTFTCPHHQAIWGKVYSKPVMFSQLVQVPWKIGYPPQPIYLEPLEKTLMWLVVRLCLVQKGQEKNCRQPR